ncbi:MAG: hypothetical protein H8E31_11600 [Planctomycetes bacterium]|nr:hypothetical protein [Planctomycetota bacterium]
MGFSGFHSPFSSRRPLPARCPARRRVVAVVSGASAETVVAVRDGLLSGEVLLIQGQSNAQAADGHGEGLANQSQRPWGRSFGSNSLDPASVAADRNWRMAEGQRGSGPAAVGAWGLRLGQLLADRQGVPIAILNGSRGGTRIDEHLRAPLDPEDLDTLYGRLLYRADRGGVRQAVTAILWLQGEADRLTSGADYADRFDQLYRAWEEDFPALEKVYVVQIRYGCLPSNLEVHEALRLAASDHPKVELMATTAVRGHDGCHYWYSGYREIGDLVERLVAHDLFGVPAIPGMRPPNVRLARYTSPQQDELRLEFHSPAAAPVFETGAEWDFLLDGGATVVSGRADGGTLLLQVSPPGAATRISYRSRPGNGPRVMTGLGVGILGFHELPIRP